MSIGELMAKASKYCRDRGLKPNFESRLGSGNEGVVWALSSAAAIKVSYGEQTFKSELKCYQALKEGRVTRIRGFNVPQLLDYDVQLLVLEMTIVNKPYLLDFGKAYFGNRPTHFSDEVMDDYYRQMEEHFA